MKSYRINLASMFIIWSFGTFAFFMVPFYLDSMSANFFFLSLASELAEFIGTVLCVIIASYIDLRRALLIFHGFVALGCIAMILVVKHNNEEDHLKTPMSDNLISAGLIMITNLGVVISFNLAYLVNPWLFPTELLATAYGILNVFGRLVTVISPIIAKLPHPFPLIVLIIYACIAGILTFFLTN